MAHQISVKWTRGASVLHTSVVWEGDGLQAPASPRNSNNTKGMGVFASRCSPLKKEKDNGPPSSFRTGHVSMESTMRTPSTVSVLFSELEFDTRLQSLRKKMFRNYAG